MASEPRGPVWTPFYPADWRPEGGPDRIRSIARAWELTQQFLPTTLDKAACEELRALFYMGAMSALTIVKGMHIADSFDQLEQEQRAFGQTAYSAAIQRLAGRLAP